MIEEKKKKFIIDEETVKETSKTLQAFVDHIDAECVRSGCMCDLRGDICSQHISNVLHNFESGLCLITLSHSEGGEER